MQVKLVIVGGKASKSQVSVKLPTVIGRSREADLTVAHPMISRKHCELYESNGLVMIRDLGSLNGLYLGSAQVRDAALRPNDEFTVGPLTFRVEYASAPQGGPPGGATTIEEGPEERWQERPPEPMTAVGEAAPDFEAAEASFPPPGEEGAVVGDVLPPVHDAAADDAATPDWPPPSAGGSRAAVAPPDGQLPDFSLWREGGPSSEPPDQEAGIAPGRETAKPGRLPSPEASVPETDLSVPETASFDQGSVADAVQPGSSTSPTGSPEEENDGSAGDQTDAEGMFDLAISLESESEDDESDDLDKFLKGLD
jgi:hypothetical protein